jgi:hypothetical protein
MDFLDMLNTVSAILNLNLDMELSISEWTFAHLWPGVRQRGPGGNVATCQLEWAGRIIVAGWSITWHRGHVHNRALVLSVNNRKTM